MNDLSFDWAYAYGEPGCHGTIRTTPEDFQVDEVLGYEPDGQGNHALLQIRKRNTNTEWLARRLAEFAAVESREVGYAGLKDRHAITTQYFSVNLGGRSEPDWSQLESEELTILEVSRHRNKLQRGRLRENRFTITVRGLQGDCATLQQRLEQVRLGGVPNYFGEQRFGRDGHNLEMAEKIFGGEIVVRDRHQRGLYLSAARSWLFNAILSRRVTEGSWLQALPGEALLQPHSRSALSLRVISDEIRQRIESGHLQPSAPLWGRGGTTALGEAAELERSVVEQYASIAQGLEQAGVGQERRALRLLAQEMSWQFEGSETLRLSFNLPPGGYATTLLRELLWLHNAAA